VIERGAPGVPPQAFREVLSRWASGVCVVTTNDGGMLYGLTVSSFTSVSLDPPLVLVCLANANRVVEMIGTSQGFAVSLLASHQESASQYFAQSGRLPTPDFTEIEGQWTPSGLPVISGSLAWLTCELHAMLPMGDHTVAVGRATGAFSDEGKEPLLYWSRGYRGLTART
jgi:flavin reductase (DIM6/NTAB) family NADH-FMN oxidoreductase RutF